MLGKFSLDTIIRHGGMFAGFFLMLYLFTMIVMIISFFVAILNDFVSTVKNSKEMQNHDFEVMDHFIDTVKELVVTNTDDNGTITSVNIYLLSFLILFRPCILGSIRGGVFLRNIREIYTFKRSNVSLFSWFFRSPTAPTGRK